MHVGDDATTVVVSAPVAAPAQDAWRALTNPDRVAMWFGELTDELKAGAAVSLQFGDGDFFDIEVSEVDASRRRLRWTWRFMGCGVRQNIEFEVLPRPDATATVIVRDREPRRARTASLELGEGWRDFTSRLQRYLATAERTRYDWRDEIDVCIELPASADDASRILIAHAGDWLPLDHGENLFTADAIVLEDDHTAGWLAIEDVAPSGPRSVRFAARPDGLRRTTTCAISIEPLGSDAVLVINHRGFRELDAPDDRRRHCRMRCAQIWVDAAWRAHEILTTQIELRAGRREAERDASSQLRRDGAAPGSRAVTADGS